jgi:two-component system, OmpR family, copper resistance phosphate regulon response regulator CusR
VESSSFLLEQRLGQEEELRFRQASFPVGEGYSEGMRLLLVEDERRLADRLAQGLREEGYAVDLAASCQAARERTAGASYDLVLLDLGLPDGSGIDLLRAWRREGMETPVLVLTARDLVDEKVEGLNAGADDYLTKPFAFEEVLARVRALLRRRAAPPRSVLAFADLTLERESRRAAKGGEPLDLTPREFALLEYFMLHPGVVLSRGRIAEHVWDEAYEARSNTIDVILARLRRKIDGDERLIQSIPGVGYVLRRDEQEEA